jgi:hypothetical protein
MPPARNLIYPGRRVKSESGMSETEADPLRYGKPAGLFTENGRLVEIDLASTLPHLP